ncbi:MAG: hypothetical protein R6U35_06605, partial [Candidatus Humimicrobiaceae bacterium]
RRTSGANITGLAQQRFEFRWRLGHLCESGHPAECLLLFTYEDTIRKFLGNWYIRKFFSPNISEIKSFLRAISDFFTFVQKEEFISKEDLSEIKDTCRDIQWFEMRLRTYFEVSREEFYQWIQEYNYDYF